MSQSQSASTHADFLITGMTCAACANRIEKSLLRLEGVETAQVNLALETARVEYNYKLTSLDKIEQKVEDLGYQVILKESIADPSAMRQQEILRHQRATIVAALLSFPLIWSMVSHFTFTDWIWIPEWFMHPWFQFTLATPVQFLLGWRFYKGAFLSLRNRSANMDVLIALGTSVAYLYSVYVSLSWSFGSEIHGSHFPELYYETSAVLITLVWLGKWLEAHAKGRTTKSLQGFVKLQAKTATVLRNNQELNLSVEKVVVGDICWIRPGQHLPIDGEVVEGQSAIDESMLTGESIPVDKKPGDRVMGGTQNLNGFLKVKATKVGKHTALAQMIKMIEEAQGSKVPIQRLADIISGIFVPIVFICSMITFLIWYFWADPLALPSALEKAIAVIVIACPCALGLATPTSIMAGTGRAAEWGILFKSGEYLESMNRVNTVVIDKTGTITIGKPQLTDVIVNPNLYVHDEKELLQWVASVEKYSEHPLAQAIIVAAKENKIEERTIEHFEAIPGYGVSASIHGHKILIGTEKLLTKHEVSLHTATSSKMILEEAGKTVMLVAIAGQYAGLVAVADAVKPSSRHAIAKLNSMGIEVIMMTGDNPRTAKAIAEEVGIHKYHAEQLPIDKANAVKNIQAEGKIVAMVGDGINDAPALAVSHIGVAMGTGTDIAMNTADVTILRGDLLGIASAISISQQTMSVIRQNLFWALGYNVIGIPIAAIGLLAPWLAGAAMAFSSVSVVLNSLRLQRVKE